MVTYVDAFVYSSTWQTFLFVHIFLDVKKKSKRIIDVIDGNSVEF